jgi:hypothetical protein
VAQPVFVQNNIYRQKKSPIFGATFAFVKKTAKRKQDENSSNLVTLYRMQQGFEPMAFRIVANFSSDHPEFFFAGIRSCNSQENASPRRPRPPANLITLLAEFLFPCCQNIGSVLLRAFIVAELTHFYKTLSSRRTVEKGHTIEILAPISMGHTLSV